MSARGVRIGEGLARVLIGWNTAEAGFVLASRFFGRGPKLRPWVVAFVPPETAEVELEVLGRAALAASATVSFLPLSRTLAAALIILRSPLFFLQALGQQRGSWSERFRAALAIAEREANEPREYGDWISLWDDWGAEEQARLLGSPRRARWPKISVVISGFDRDLVEITQESLRDQWGYPTVQVRCTGVEEAIGPVLRQTQGDYVALLQAGEVLPPHALAVLADQAVRWNFPDTLCADEDRLNRAGRRQNPLFKPELNHALIISGTMTRGVWLVRRDILVDAVNERLSGWAESVRLDLWLRLYERMEPPRSRRIPFVLTYRHPDTEEAPVELLAGIVRSHLTRYLADVGRAAELSEMRVPMRWRISLPAAQHRRISLIVPSAARARHVTRCLDAILSRTDYEDLELVIVVTQDHALDAKQQEILSPILRDSRARVVVRHAGTFNFSSAINYGTSVAAGGWLCFLNDDVEPIGSRWLEFMAGQLADPRVGAVGAKLLYPDGRVQHGGVIMGLAGLCEHAFKYAPHDSIGYGSRNVLDQELSAVTAACMLVRREAFDSVGGLDDSYSIAFNDVDFCLRLRERRWRVVFSATAELIHHESASLGHHYAGDRAPLEQIEISRMRERWREACRADPFHNPNLSLRLGHEWQLAFPPRVSRPFADPTKDAVTGAFLEPSTAIGTSTPRL